MGARVLQLIPPEPPDPPVSAVEPRCDFMVSRVILATPMDARLRVTLEAVAGEEEHVALEIRGEENFDGYTIDRGGVGLSVHDPAVIRVLGETLVALADRAERVGMFDALRASEARGELARQEPEQ